jgi:SAM-dependent methyltransferase
MKIQASQPNLPESGSVAGQQTNSTPSNLTSMDALYAYVTEQDLAPVFEELADENSRIRLLDISAEPGMVTEKFCEREGVEYYALNANEDLLDARSTDTAHKILASAEATGSPDGSFDVTFSRKAAAWNADPRAIIAEQLRVTRLGGYAVFTEFDWTHAGAVEETELTAAAMATKAMMMRILTPLGFKPEYGARLRSDIYEVTQTSGIACEQTEARYDLPAGDYRGILLEEAEKLLDQLRQFRHPLTTELQSNIQHIRKAESFSFHLPALVTNVVHLA